MSYLRSLSNPEGLYVVDGRRKKGTIDFLRDGEIYTMPKYIFDYLMCAWIDGRESTHYRGASVFYGKDTESNDWKVFVTYNKWADKKIPVLKMWEVTWSFIVHSHEKYYEKQMRRFNQ